MSTCAALRSDSRDPALGHAAWCHDGCVAAGIRAEVALLGHCVCAPALHLAPAAVPGCPGLASN